MVTSFVQLVRQALKLSATIFFCKVDFLCLSQKLKTFGFYGTFYKAFVYSISIRGMSGGINPGVLPGSRNKASHDLSARRLAGQILFFLKLITNKDGPTIQGYVETESFMKKEREMLCRSF
jgi:hypothetical protein